MICKSWNPVQIGSNSDWPTAVVWWGEDDHRPDWREAISRLEHIYDNGNSPVAFTFRSPFGPDGTPTTLHLAIVKAKTEARDNSAT